MTTAVVAGVFKTPDGAVYPNRPVVFEMLEGQITSNGADVIVPTRVEATTSSTGAISVSLERGRAYSLRVTGNDGVKFGRLTVPDSAGPFDLADRIEKGVVQVIPAEPPTSSTSYQFATRAAFVAAALTGLPDGTVVSAGGLFYVRSTGASAIADLSGWLPHGVASPDHFATNATPGTTDMTAAVLAAFAWVSSIGGGRIDGRGNTFAVSAEIALLETILRVVCDDCTFVALGTWAADTGMFRISRNGAVERRWIGFRRCRFEGNQEASGILVSDAGFIAVIDCDFHAFPDFGVRSETKATELRIEGCEFKQFYFGETNWNVEASRTAYAIDITTADYIIERNVANYCREPFRISTRGPGQLRGNHFYNGGLASASGETRCGTISAPNCMVQGNYFDNGIVRVDASVLDGTCSLMLQDNLFHKNASATNTHGLEIFGGSTSTLAGLVLDGNVFENQADAVLFTGTYADDESRLWSVSGNVTKTGARIDGLPDIAVRNTFHGDSASGFVWRTPRVIFRPVGTEEATQILFRRGAILNVDHDSDSSSLESIFAVRVRGGDRFRAGVTGIAFFDGVLTAKQTVTGSRGSNAALASLLTALAAYGLITDSTS